MTTHIPTPRTDACPHCGASIRYKLLTGKIITHDIELCCERKEKQETNLVKCYCPRCITGVHDDIQLAAQYRKHAEWKTRAEKAEAEVERLKALFNKLIEEVECGPECVSRFGDHCNCGRLKRANKVIIDFDELTSTKNGTTTN